MRWWLGYVSIVWVSTSMNPADHPSRFNKLPVPSAMPPWVAELYEAVPRASTEGFYTKEYYSGVGGLSLALKA